MSKVAIVSDSNSGITQSQAKELGVFVLPMPFTIGNEEYFEDINLTQEQFYEKLKGGDDIRTSQPSPEMVMKMWDEVLQDYDEIVHIPMSSGLSGSCQSAMMLAEEYDGKVQVVNNQRISVTMKSSVMEAKRMAGKGYSASRIKQILEEHKFDSSIYIMLDTLYYLKKGGRITPAAAALGTLLKLKPVLQIQGEKLDAFAKARTVSQAKTIMINAMKSDMEHRFGEKEGVPLHTHLYIAHTENYEGAEQFKKEIEEAIPGSIVEYVDPLSLSISCHIGPGALAIASSMMLPDELEEKGISLS
ncbi:MAG: DegV family protein [Lachnospiraceae bacterium]|nr:DegV family protein [Lachnospiraceae bacterium]